MSNNIAVTSIPDGRKNWVMSVEIKEPVYIKIRLVPDRLIADHESIKNYILDVSKKSWRKPEEMILTIIEDINNELVPKWVEASYSKNGVSVKLEDQQPGLGNFSPPPPA